MKKTYIVIASAIMILFCLMYSVSYAYFSVKVTNDFNGSDKGNTTIGSDTVKDIIISDGAKVTSQNIIPGDSVTSVFNVKNPNNVSICFGLTWADIVNEFTRKSDLVVSLQDENGEVLIENVEFPSDNDTTFIEGLSVPANTTKKYILTVIYKSVNEDQTTDMNKKFHATITGKVTECKKTTATETITNLVSGANTSSTDVITVSDKTSDSCTYTLAYDGTSDNNLRYVGANPCNYVKIDNEIWRIIGLMNNIDDGTGKKETRLKLIRNESIGKYPWDSSASSVNDGYGVNEWSQADLMKLLNPGYESESVGGSLYYNNSSGNCYSSNNNGTKACDFTSSGLKTNLKNLVGNTLWNTGTNGTNDFTSASNGLASHFYSYERSSNTGKICTSGSCRKDNVARTTTWNGKIGLMYPSDYGYATSGGTSMNRASCLAKELYNWNGASASDCYNNDWLYNSSNVQWTISPSANSWNTIKVFTVFNVGYVDSSEALYPNLVRPSVYLISKTSILGGEGTLENPYEIG